MSSLELAIDATLLCDDVRREMSGKFVVIGAYSINLVVPSFPQELAFAVYVEGEVITGGELVATLRVEDEDGGVLFRSENVIPPTTGKFIEGRFGLGLNSFFTATKNTQLKFIANVSGREYLLLTRRVYDTSAAQTLAEAK